MPQRRPIHRVYSQRRCILTQLRRSDLKNDRLGSVEMEMKFAQFSCAFWSRYTAELNSLTRFVWFSWNTYPGSAWSGRHKKAIATHGKIFEQKPVQTGVFKTVNRRGLCEPRFSAVLKNLIDGLTFSVFWDRWKPRFWFTVEAVWLSRFKWTDAYRYRKLFLLTRTPGQPAETSDLKIFTKSIHKNLLRNFV